MMSLSIGHSPLQDMFQECGACTGNVECTDGCDGLVYEHFSSNRGSFVTAYSRMWFSVARSCHEYRACDTYKQHYVDGTMVMLNACMCINYGSETT